MNPARAAMRRPVTVLVVVAAIIAMGVFAVRSMPRDIFPDLGVPVIYVAQPYGGLDPAQMEGFLVNYYEYHFLYITGIEHVESKSIQGIGLVKLQFHPGTNMAQAMAETVSYVNRARAFMPTGTVPPFIMRFDAGSVPVGNLVFSSAGGGRTVSELQDAALFKVRPLFATLQGVSAPPPFGASQRTIVIHADPERLRAYRLSPDDLVAAVTAGNTITPSGNALIGESLPMVPVNTVVTSVAEMGTIPVRSDGTRTIFVRDVATVEDGSDIQTGYALVNGVRTVYIPVTKRADASTLAVVNLVRENLPRFQAALPDDIRVRYEFDQSPYVIRAIRALVFEGALGAVLTGLVVLVFLRDWRSAVVVVLNIPIALLASAVGLWVSGHTVNVMTLGGLALSVGILVDEATVTIESMHARMATGENVARAAMNGARETALPRLLAMLCVLAVFVPALFMTGSARSLFVPLALAVGFSMIASYLLSSSLVPVLSVWLLARHGGVQARSVTGGVASRVRAGYARVLRGAQSARAVLVPAYFAAAALAVVLIGGRLGTEIFPTVDTGQFEVRFRARAGSDIDRTERIALGVLDAIKREVGPDNVALSLGFVGVQPPTYPINTIYLWTAGPEEAVLQVQLKPGLRIAVEPLKERLRAVLPAEFEGVRFAFAESDIISRVMSFGAAAPIEVAVSGPSMPDNRAYAERVVRALSGVASLRDVQVQQEQEFPVVRVAVDRERAGVMATTAEEVGRAVVPATSSSRFTAPNYWPDPRTGVGYQVQIEVPRPRMSSVEDIRNIPLGGRRGDNLNLRDVATVSVEDIRNIPLGGRRGDNLNLRDVATVSEESATGEYDRYNMQRMLTITAGVSGEDLGHAAGRVADALRSAGAAPERVSVAVRGQTVPLSDLVSGLSSGLIVAIGAVFLLLSGAFQSLRVGAAVLLTVPGVLAGVGVALWVTRSTLNIESYIGAIMAVGVAMANAILLVTFVEQRRRAGTGVAEAAVEGAAARLRPILMTSLAMIAGMTPMALGIGEGGEQTAPLGRAVIGGLVGGTTTTLLLLPLLLVMILPSVARSASMDPDDPQSPLCESGAPGTPGGLRP